MNLLCHVPNNLHGNSTITTTTHHINYKEANCFGPSHTSASPATGKYPILMAIRSPLSRLQRLIANNTAVKNIQHFF